MWLARPLLDVPKSRLVATLSKAKIAFADDPTNRDMSFTRPRLRALMPALAEEGGDSRNLARLAARLARANAAIEVLADGAERYLALRDRDDASRFGFDAGAFAGLPEEIRLRLLKRAIDRAGHEGPAELGKVEALLAVLDRAIANGERQTRLKQTLAGAAISLTEAEFTSIRHRRGGAIGRERRPHTAISAYIGAKSLNHPGKTSAFASFFDRESR